MSEAKYECFSDPSYFDQWCVREIGERRFGYGFHVPTQAEAMGLCALLNGLTAERGALSAQLRAAAGEQEVGFRWTPLEFTSSPPTGRYIVGHRGFAFITHYLNPHDREWDLRGTIKLGWQRDPSEIRATHYAPLPEIVNAAILAAKEKK